VIESLDAMRGMRYDWRAARTSQRTKRTNYADEMSDLAEGKESDGKGSTARVTLLRGLVIPLTHLSYPCTGIGIQPYDKGGVTPLFGGLSRRR
jgi:hypothetical protein